MFQSLPPVSSDPETVLRQEHTRLRVQLLYGQHAGLVRRRVQRQIGAVRAAAWGDPDLSSNPFAASCAALATLYDPTDDGESAPTLVHADAEAATSLGEVLDGSGLWPLMQRVQRDTLGLRETFVRVDSDFDDAGLPVLRFREVTPDLVEASPDPRDPTQPIEVRESVQRRDPRTGRLLWTRDVWSIAGGRGSYRILAGDGQDLSPTFGLPAGGLVGEDYPVLGEHGPLLPYVCYHAALTGTLFDPWADVELFEGTLNCCVLYTFYGHLVRNAAWAQRYAVDIEVAGGKRTVDGGTEAAREAAVADPSTVLMLKRVVTDDKSAPIIGQFGPGADPQAVAESISTYERRLHARAGLDPADVQRISGDPRSGYAIAMSRASKDQHALRYSPVFRRSDRQLVRLSAALLNGALGFRAWPESGWDLEHAPIRAIRARARQGPQPPTPVAA